MQLLSVDAQKEGLKFKGRMLTHQGKHVLDKENFRSYDFWQGYKLYCYAQYSHCRRSRRRFLASKMGRVVHLLDEENHPLWGANFDERVRQVWAMMEEYAEVILGRNWRNLRALMEKFDDVKQLSASENGCLLLQLVEDDDYGTEHLLRQSHAVHLDCTNIFEELQDRLKRVGSNLDRLKESAGSSSKVQRNERGKRVNVG